MKQQISAKNMDTLKSLLETNPYLRDPETRRRMLERNALDSSAFEGARGLKPRDATQPPAAPRTIARKKKPVKSS